MEFHLTPVIKATPETTVVQHLYNTTEERIYGMYFENGTKSVYLKVPYNLTKPIEFFEMRYDTYENKSYVNYSYLKTRASCFNVLVTY